MKPMRIAFLAATAMAASAGLAHANPINVVAYDPTGKSLIDFEDAAATAFPGTVYNGTLTSGGATLSERFVGQVLTSAGDNDVLSGTPTGPLTLQAGAANQSLDLGTDNGTHNLIPCGPRGCADPNGYGEGAFAVRFGGGTGYFGFQEFFADSPNAVTTLDFFDAAGGLIQRVTVGTSGSFGFSREGGAADIAGVSVFTGDLGGLGYDNLLYDGHNGGGVPEPSAWALMILGFGLAGSAVRRRRAAFA